MNPRRPGDPATGTQHAVAARKARPPVRGRWLSLSALVFPLIFFAVVAVGLASMLTRRMSIFRPGSSHAPITQQQAPAAPGGNH